jgi:hypothetical protein
MGERMYKKIQYGKEGTKGSEVNATKIFLGDAGVPGDRAYVFPAYNLAVATKAAEAHLYQQLVDNFTLNIDNGYFQALPMLLSMALKGNITANPATTGQSDYLWTFSPSWTATNNQDSFTFEVGDDIEQYLLTYVMAKKITIAGAMGQNQAIKLSAECFAKAVAPTDFTNSLTIPAVEPMVANQTKLYINPTWATRGNTQKTGLLRDFSLEIITGLHPQFHGNGLTFDVHGESYIDAMLKMTLEGNSVADGYYDGFQAGTPYAIRLKIIGSQIGSGATHSLVVDLWGKFEEMQPMGSEADGNNLHVALFHGLYDPTPITGLAMLACTVTTNSNSV